MVLYDVELRLTKKDNRNPHEINVGDWDTGNSIWIAALQIKENVEKALSVSITRRLTVGRIVF